MFLQSRAIAAAKVYALAAKLIEDNKVHGVGLAVRLAADLLKYDNTDSVHSGRIEILRWLVKSEDSPTLAIGHAITAGATSRQEMQDRRVMLLSLAAVLVLAGDWT